MSLVSMTWPEYLAGCCRINGHLTRLAFREADVLLALLLANPDGWVTRQRIVEVVWPDADKQPVDASNVITIEVMRLRRRGIVIENRHGFGYCIPRGARGRPERFRLAA